MDLFIWDPSYSQDEHSFPAKSLAQNFYFTQTLDIIEEDAINEKCCLQVLEILIAKADTEIAELEDDIVMLQSQLARTEWLDMSITALNKKIDHLGSSITALKNGNVQASGVHLQTNTSERIHEMLETPLIKFSSPRDKQPANSTLGSSKLAVAVLIKVEATDDHDLKDVETAEMNGSLTVQADATVQTPSVVQEENHQETDEHTITKDSSATAFGHDSDKSILKDVNESDIPGKLIDASKQENPSHLKNFACAVLKSASTKPLRDKAQFCGTPKRKINMLGDFSKDELMQQSSNDGITINSSPEVKETSIGEGPKPAGAILVTSLTTVKQQPEESGDEQTQNGGKGGQTSEKHTSSQLVSKKQTGARSFLRIEGDLLNPKNKDRSKQLEKFNGEQQVKQSCKSQALSIIKSNSKLSRKLEGQRLNIKWKIPPKKVKEPCLAKELGLRRQLKTESTKENGGDEFGYKTIKGSLSLREGAKGSGDPPEITLTSLIPLKKRRIASFTGPILQENDEFGDKTIKEILSLHEGAKGTGDPPGIISTSLIPLKKRRIVSVTGPVLQENENLRDFQNRLAKSHDQSNQNLVIKAENDELLDSTTFIVPTPSIADLKKMTKNQLKAVARQHNLHRVSKLRKAELQERLHELLAKGRSTYKESL